MSDTAARSSEVVHECYCVLIWGDEQRENNCSNRVVGADVPFCAQCEDRHPGFEIAHPGARVTTKPLGLSH